MKSISRKTNARTLDTGSNLERPIKLYPVAAHDEPRDFAATISEIYASHRGTGLSSVLQTAADDLLAVVGALENDPNSNVHGAHIRQLIELWEVLLASSVEAGRSKAGGAA